MGVPLAPERPEDQGQEPCGLGVWGPSPTAAAPRCLSTLRAGASSPASTGWLTSSILRWPHVSACLCEVRGSALPLPLLCVLARLCCVAVCSSVRVSSRPSPVSACPCVSLLLSDPAASRGGGVHSPQFSPICLSMSLGLSGSLPPLQWDMDHLAYSTLLFLRTFAFETSADGWALARAWCCPGHMAHQGPKQRRGLRPQPTPTHAGVLLPFLWPPWPWLWPPLLVTAAGQG